MIALSPGWVKTGMGGPSAHISPEESIAGMLAVSDGPTMKDSGEFFN